MGEHRQQAGADPGIVVVGSGPAGLRLVQELYALHPLARVTLFGGEPWEPYDRVALSLFLAGEVAAGDIFCPPRVPDAAPFCAHYNLPIVAIDRPARRVRDAAGAWHAYDRLVLSVGSRPHVPGIPGVDLPGVYTFRDMNDAQRLMARTARSHRTLVLGGGLLGLEAARALQRAGTDVTVVDHGPRLLGRQLDAAASERVSTHLRRLGIGVVLGDGAAQVLGAERCEGLRLRSGRELPADTLVLATGIRPNTALALDAGLAVRDGIVVNDALQTSDPDIYAIGECAEHGGRVYGIVAPALEQAAVVAHRLCDQPAAYHGSTLATRLKVVGCAVFSVGRAAEDDLQPGDRKVVYRDDAAGVYRSLVIGGGRLVGAVGFGPWDDWQRVQEAASRRARCWPWQQRRFARCGTVWPGTHEQDITAWPAAATVCACKGISRGALSRAVAGGCADAPALSRATGAGTVCGSCQPLLAQFYGHTLARQPVAGARWLAGGSLLAALVLVVLVLTPGWSYPDTFDLELRWDRLWRSGQLKQLTGFSLLGLAVLGLVLSLRKRFERLRLGSFGAWRVVHVMLGLLALLVLGLHTGFRVGSNLNAWLMVDFLALAALGSVAGLVTAFEHRAGPGRGKALRSRFTWLHIVLFWPLPVLLGFHVLKTYYF